LRLDNYVYTVEGIREAVRHLNDDGIMCLSFCETDRSWLGRRIYRNITLAAGFEPVATLFQNKSFFLFGPTLDRRRAESVLRAQGLPIRSDFYRKSAIRPSTDDWPFLYSNPDGQPFVYYFSLALLVVAACVLIFRIVRSESSAVATRFDWHMFLLGGGFLLVETKALAELAVLFGSTWIVNTLVFSGVFVMVLLSVWVVHRRIWVRLDLAYVFLAAVLVGWYIFPRAALNALPFGVRAVIGTVLVVLPLFFAGIVFARSFAEKKDSAAAFGSNLIGAVIGGATEAASLAWGIRSLTLLALLFYLLSWLVSGEASEGSNGAGRRWRRFLALSSRSES
jgi:hypothetical protein